MTPTYQCPICARTFHTALFASLHAETFHQPPPSPAVQQFERVMRDQWNAGLNTLSAAPAAVRPAPGLPGARDGEAGRDG